MVKDGRCSENVHRTGGGKSKVQLTEAKRNNIGLNQRSEIMLGKAETLSTMIQSKVCVGDWRSDK